MVTRALVVGSLGLAGIAGCSIEGLELQGKACPCADGYRCDDFTRLCVLDGNSDEIAIDTPDGGAYRIDAAEVTAREYRAFLNSDPDPTAQPARCAWNTSFIPAMGSPDNPGSCVPPFDLEQFPNQPIRCVDWCDAQAYCAWKDQALCGRIGGGSLQSRETNDADRGQWFRACSRGGRLTFPYGNLYEPRCNTGDPERTARDVTNSRCEGGYPGLFDMSGNVAEWEDSCMPSDVPGDLVSEYCPLRGGAYFGYTSDVRCDSTGYAVPRSWMGLDIGFRCCRG
jgi:formylglycine-generating enzyme